MRNFLEMKYSQTSALLMCIMIAQLLSYLLWAGYSVNHIVYYQYVSAAIEKESRIIYCVSIVLALFWLVLCRKLYESERASLFLSTGAIIIYATTMLYAGYVSGLLAVPLGLVLIGMPMLGIIMLPPRLVLITLVFSGCIILVMSYLTVIGILPYAPLFNGNLLESQESRAFYFFAEIYFAAPFLMIVVFIAHRFLQQWRLREAKIKHMSQTDALTNIFNRRIAHERLHDLMARPEQIPVSVILLDLDYFKKINDTHGHHTGDQVLKCAALTLKSSLRSDDLLARFGGEEFLIILDGMTCYTARAVAQRCRRLLTELQLMSDVGASVPVSASFGVACLTSGNPAQVDELLRQADAALYEAKAAGRNCVIGHSCSLEHADLTHPLIRRAHHVTRTHGRAKS